MGELSKERLSELRDYFIDLQDFYSDPSDRYNYDVFRYAEEIASRLLSAEEQQPVAWMVTDIDTGERIIRSDRSYIEGPSQPLYAAPQLPQQGKAVQVPDELLSAMEEVLRISARDHEFWHKAKEGIAALRAAMLSNEPVSQSYKLVGEVVAWNSPQRQGVYRSVDFRWLDLNVPPGTRVYARHADFVSEVDQDPPAK